MIDFCYRSGNIETRLVRTKEELRAALKLRYTDLILEYNPNNTNDEETDYSPIDDICDHLVAIDLNTNEVIGTYRLIRSAHSDTFISESEYDISKIKHCNLLEISRAVVKKEYRDGAAIQLLWKSIIHYANHYDTDYMIGTASFCGVDVNEYKEAFSYLHYHHLSPDDILCVAKEPCHRLDIIPASEFNSLEAKHNLPPLVKGYLRLGCTIGQGIYIDRPFNSLDVLIVLEIKKINPRYLKRFLGCDCEQ